jgi:uridine kinase
VTPLDQVLDLLRSRPATLGEGRFLSVDGPAGSGKTTLAELVTDAWPGARLLHLDDFVEGWDGLVTVDAQLDDLLRPLAEGRPGSMRRYDWVAGAYAETVVVEPAPLLVLEGCGSGAGAYADVRTALVWVEAPHDLRMHRGIERDGDAFAPYWERWAREEAALFAREQTRERADVRLDGTRPYSASS